MKQIILSCSSKDAELLGSSKLEELKKRVEESADSCDSVFLNIEKISGESTNDFLPGMDDDWIFQ